MTFQATPAEVFSALTKAARRTGLQYLSGDVRAGTAMFTSGRSLLMVGEKVTVLWKQGGPGSVQVTLSPASFGLAGVTLPGGGHSADRLADELSRLLPHAG